MYSLHVGPLPHIKQTICHNIFSNTFWTFPRIISKSSHASLNYFSIICTACGWFTVQTTAPPAPGGSLRHPLTSKFNLPYDFTLSIQLHPHSISLSNPFLGLSTYNAFFVLYQDFQLISEIWDLIFDLFSYVYTARKFEPPNKREKEVEAVLWWSNKAKPLD